MNIGPDSLDMPLVALCHPATNSNHTLHLWLLWTTGARRDNQSAHVYLDFATSFGASPHLYPSWGRDLSRTCLKRDRSRMGHTQNCFIHFALGLRVPAVCRWKTEEKRREYILKPAGWHKKKPQSQWQDPNASPPKYLEKKPYHRENPMYN